MTLHRKHRDGRDRRHRPVRHDEHASGSATATSQVAADHNTFTGNDDGVVRRGDGRRDRDASSANRNGIAGNTNVRRRPTRAPTTVDATCNWWGSASGPSGAGPGSGDAVSANVAFGSWLTSSNLNGACSTSTVVGGADQTIAEGNSGNHNVTIPVTLSSTQATPVTVQYATANGSAKKGKDYIAKSGTVTIPANTLSANVVISVNGDTKGEQNESFTVNFSNPVGATLQHPTTTINLMNDDLKIKKIKNATGYPGVGGAVHFVDAGEVPDLRRDDLHTTCSHARCRGGGRLRRARTARRRHGVVCRVRAPAPVAIDRADRSPTASAHNETFTLHREGLDVSDLQRNGEGHDQAQRLSDCVTP